jgi:transcription initiation factor IIE alpha subunit
MKRTQKFLTATFIGVFVMVALIGSFTGISYAQKDKVYYTCPMPEHSDVVMDKPGKCPKCGMTLVKKEKPATTKYTCPMPEHSDVVMDKPGKCPKCGMTLVPMQPDKN